MELITVLGEVDFSLNKIVFWHQNKLNFKKNEHCSYVYRGVLHLLRQSCICGFTWTLNPKEKVIHLFNNILIY